MDESGGGSVIWLVLGLAVLVLIAGRWFRGRMLQNRAANWPMTTGTVETAEMQLERRGNNQSVHFATIAYSYHAAGAVHLGEWKRSTMLHGKVQGWIDRHPAGTALMVRYDTDNPASSVVLETDQPD